MFIMPCTDIALCNSLRKRQRTLHVNHISQAFKNAFQLTACKQSCSKNDGRTTDSIDLVTSHAPSIPSSSHTLHDFSPYIRIEVPSPAVATPSSFQFIQHWSRLASGHRRQLQALTHLPSPLKLENEAMEQVKSHNTPMSEHIRISRMAHDVQALSKAVDSCHPQCLTTCLNSKLFRMDVRTWYEINATKHLSHLHSSTQPSIQFTFLTSAMSSIIDLPIQACPSSLFHHDLP